jgi:hypothetical protein
MLSKNNTNQRDQLEMVALDQLVPQEHLVCKIKAINFSFIYDLVKDVYSELGQSRLPLIYNPFVYKLKPVFHVYYEKKITSGPTMKQ